MASLFASLFDFLLKISKYILDGFLYVIKASLYFVFDGLLTVMQTAITAIDFSSLALSTALNWSGLPEQTIYLLNQWGIPQCLTIIAAAITIRMLLNLIPAAFTRI